MGIMAGFPPPPEKRPTLENWDLAPFNRWSFQNMRRLFPTVDVRRGETAVSDLREDLQDLRCLTFRDAEGEDATIGNWLNDSYTDGLIVLKKVLLKAVQLKSCRDRITITEKPKMEVSALV